MKSKVNEKDFKRKFEEENSRQIAWAKRKISEGNTALESINDRIRVILKFSVDGVKYSQK